MKINHRRGRSDGGLFAHIDIQATERIRRTVWVLRPHSLSLPPSQQEQLMTILTANADTLKRAYHSLLFELRDTHKGESFDQLVERSSELRTAYELRREAETLLHVLCRQTEQTPPYTLKGARPC
jgi:hypothetical protein